MRCTVPVGQGAGLHRLQDVRVTAQNDVGAVVKEKVCNLFLMLILRGLIFHAPVYNHCDEVRGQCLGCGQIVGNARGVQNLCITHVVGVQNIDRIGMGLTHRNAIGAVSIRQERDLDTTHIGNMDTVLRGALLSRAIGTDVRKSKVVQHIQRAHHAVVSAIQTVIVCRADQIETSVFERISERVWCVKRRET